MTERLPFDCFDGEDLVPLETAWAAIAGGISAVSGSETVPLVQAAGRVCATPVISQINVPDQPNAAVDGFAFRIAELPESGILPVFGKVAAGAGTAAHLPEGFAMQVFTGAVLPQGTDCVVMEEDCTVSGKSVQVHVQPKPDMNCRPAGENIHKSEVLIPEGQRIRPQETGLLALAGQSTAEVRRKLKIAVFSTGNELVPHAGTCGPGQTHDTNRPMVIAALTGPSVEISDAGLLPDDAQQIEQALARLAADTDFIVTSGGASFGEEDHVRRALMKLGTCQLWRLGVKPGRPVTFGTIGRAQVVALPGNPVAALVMTYMIVKPILKALQGEAAIVPEPLTATSAFSRRKKPGRSELVRVKLQDGALIAFDRDGAGILPSLGFASGLAWLPPECEGVSPGDLLRYFPFEGLAS